jgi:hypothetical protein
MTEYPEHEKLKAIAHLSQAQYDFMEWLGEQGYILCELNQDDYYPVYKPMTKLLSEYHGIDMNKIEDEKEQMIEEMRKANQ